VTALSIHAGPRARARILEEGLHPDLFRVMVGASGGPKWFVLYGLDRYLFGEFFASRQQPLYTLGSSAGAWRLACLSTAEPLAAIERLAELYSHERYSAQPTPKEVSDQARVLLNKVLGDEGEEDIAANPVFRLHIVADRFRGLSATSPRFQQATMLAASAALNALSRRSLNWFLERTLFTNLGNLSPWADLDDIATATVKLDEGNVIDALIASGSIPFVLEAVADIAGAKPGLYWDGGISDYHFDLPFLDSDELVLYPHFQGRVVPGWFDKHLPWRHASARNYDNVVLLAPSPEFVATLPGGKLSDRNDFKNLEYEQRVSVFQEVLARSQLLAEEFAGLVVNGIDGRSIKPIGNLR